MEFVTIKSSHYQNDLVVLQSRLESEDIECRLKNELTTQVFTHIPSFLVELQVSKSDLPRVQEIMIENGEWKEEHKKAACPNCGSEKIKLKLGFAERVKLFFSLVYVLLGTDIPMDKLFKNVKFRCPDCRNEFY